MKLWTDMDTASKTRLSLVLSILFFGVAVASFVHNRQQYINAEAVYKKISARTERARQEVSKPVAVSVAAAPDALRKQLDEVAAGSAALRQRIAAAEARLVPVDDTAAQQALQENISRLADAAGLRVTKFALRGRPAEREGTPPTADRMSAVFDNTFRRPLYEFTARGSFPQVLAFLDQLPALPATAAPVQFATRIRSETAPPAVKGGPPQLVQWMELELVLAL